MIILSRVRRRALRVLTLLLLVAAGISQAQAAIITGKFKDLGNHKWTVNLSLANDGDAAGINEFTVYFAQSLFSDLSVLASPANWDSFVAQPDVPLASPGFFDSFNLQPVPIGQSQAGFTAGFTFLGQGAPAALAFDIVGADFRPTFSGVTTDAVTAVPEPSTGWLLFLGCTLFALSKRIRKGAPA